MTEQIRVNVSMDREYVSRAIIARRMLNQGLPMSTVVTFLGLDDITPLLSEADTEKAVWCFIDGCIEVVPEEEVNAIEQLNSLEITLTEVEGGRLHDIEGGPGDVALGYINYLQQTILALGGTKDDWRYHDLAQSETTIVRQEPMPATECPPVNGDLDDGAIPIPDAIEASKAEQPASTYIPDPDDEIYDPDEGEAPQTVVEQAALPEDPAQEAPKPIVRPEGAKGRDPTPLPEQKVATFRKRAGPND